MNRIKLSRSASTLRLVVALAFLAIVALGCAGMFRSKDQQPMQNYVFSPRQFVQSAPTSSHLVLLVSSVQSVGYDARHMAYSMRPYERTFYAFSQWADTPPRLIQPLVVQTMEASGYFRAVIESSSSSPADVRLDLDLLVLQHEYDSTWSQGRMVIRAQLNDLETNGILGTRIFESTAPAPMETPYGGVLALNVTLENILGELVVWVAELLGVAPIDTIPQVHAEPPVNVDMPAHADAPVEL
jgi:cholesterol transport system auxiliary component